MACREKQAGSETAGGVKHPAGRQFIADCYYFSNHIFVRSFSLFVQRKRTKRKASLSLDPALRDSPALLEMTGSLKTRYAQTGQTPVSVISLVLGYVKWLLKPYFISPFILKCCMAYFS
jgi:hypothetical protein